MSCVKVAGVMACQKAPLEAQIAELKEKLAAEEASDAESIAAYRRARDRSEIFREVIIRLLTSGSASWLCLCSDDEKKISPACSAFRALGWGDHWNAEEFRRQVKW